MADARSQCNKAKMPTGRGQKSEEGHYNHEIEGAKDGDMTRCRVCHLACFDQREGEPHCVRAAFVPDF